MKTKTLFFSSLLAAAAMSTVPALAEDITLTNGVKTTLTISEGTTGAGNTYSYAAPAETDKGGWLWFGDPLAGTGNVAFGTSDSQMKLSGTGIIAVGYQGGNQGVIYNFDFSNTNASAFSGKFAVVNEWNNNTVVKLSGTNWSNVEYIFGGVSREESWATVRMYGNTDRGYDTLSLTGATTLAGITGTSKGYVPTGDGAASGIGNVNLRESITASTSGTVLTLSGAGTYSYYGSVGTSSVSIGLEKTGTGTQTFGGAAKYLSSVKVSAGTLALTEGTVTISGNATVASDAALDLSGATVSLSSAISNSGTVTVDSSTVFALAGLTGTKSENTTTFTIVDGGTLNGAWTSLTADNVDLSGVTSVAVRDMTLVFADTDSKRTVSITSVAGDLVWNSGNTSGDWNYTTDNTPWTITSGGVATAASFMSGDNATFKSDATVTVDSSGITAGTVTVSAGTLTLAGQQYVTAGSIDIAEDATLNLGTLGTGVAVSQKLTGTGTVSFTSTHGNTINLGTEFKGTVNISGDLQLKDASFGASTATLNLMTGVHLWSQYSCAPVIEQAINFKSGQSKIGGWGSATSSITLSGDLTFEDGASLYVTNANASTAVVLNISGAMTNATLKQDSGTTNISLSEDSSIKKITRTGGTVNLTQTAGTLTISGATEVSTLTLSGGAVEVTGSGKLTGTVSSMAAGTTLTLAGTDSSTVTISGTVGGGATLNITNGNVTWTHDNADVTTTATITIGEGSSFKDNSNCKHTLELSGKLSGAGTLISGVATNAGQGDGDRRTVTLSGSTADFTGTWELETASDSNTSGNRRVNGILDSSDDVFGGVISFTDSSASASKTSSKLSLARDMTIGGLKGTLSNTIVQSSNEEARALTINTVAGASYDYAGTIASTISSLVKKGTGSQTLSGDNSAFTGGVTLSAGTLELGHNNALGDATSSTLEVTDSSTLTLGSGLNVANTIASHGAGLTLTLNSAGDAELSGVLAAYYSGTTEVKKTGAGTLTLSGDNSTFMHGTISVEEGTLLAKSANALGTVSQYTDNAVRLSGGTLKVGSGVTLAQTNIEIALSDAYKTSAAITGESDTAALAEGTKISIISIDGGADIAVATIAVSTVSSQYNYKIADTILGGSLKLSDFSLSSELQDEGWKIAAYSSESGVLTLTIPEPSTFGLLAGVGALAFVAARRRRRAK